MQKKPFFSIVIPCYNSRKTLSTLLNSIIAQQMSYNDIQVILSDDCSTESYQDIVDKYKNLLYITQVKTDYNCCPGNTRQKGVQAVEGDWIIFSDHDDEFFPNTLKRVKQLIEKNHFDTAVFTPFVKRTQQGQMFKMPINAGWTHGKFFNKKFWEKYNLHYIKDMTSHEDVCISTQLEYIRQTYKEDYYQINTFCYIWNENPDSLSNRKYIKKKKERVFLDVFFIDYIESTAGISYFMYNRTGLNKQWVSDEIKKVLLYSYFYFEFSKDVVPEYLTENLDHVKKYLKILNEEFNCSIEDVYNYFKITNKQQYVIIFEMAIGQTAQFLYEKSFLEWLKWIWEDKY